LFVFSRFFRFSIAFVSLAIVIEAAFTALVPLSLRYFIDHVLTARDLRSMFLVLGILTAGTALSLVSGLLRDFLAAREQARILSALRQRLFERLQHLSISFHFHAAKAGLLERFSTDFPAIENAVALALPWGILPAIESILSTGLMFWLNWRSGLAGCLLWPWILLAPRLAKTRTSRAAVACGEQESRILRAVRENVAAQAIVRAFSLENTGIAAFRQHNDLLALRTMRAGLLSSFRERFTASGIVFIQILILALTVWLAFEKRISIGTLVALQLLPLTLSGSLLSIVQYLPAIVVARDASRRIGEMLDAPPATEDREDARYLPPFQSEIVFSKVDFSYGGERKDLSGVTARIVRGSYVAFVGPSGSGKSTMLNLLMRFYDPQHGRITIDGHDLRSVTQASLRSRIGVVLQENSPLNMSLRDSIRLGKPEASEEEVTAVAKAAGLHDFIMGLPRRYETGADLPAAPMQRLAIARAMLRNPEILLLDEATSALDPADEEAVNETLRAFRKGRTVISVTHRLATAADADHIFVFEKGRIVEQGSHFELLAANGTYAGFWRKQAGFTFSADGRHVDVDAQRLKAFPILEKLDEDQLGELAPYFATETFPPGRDIVSQNDPGDRFYIIARGQVEVWRTEEQSGNTTRVAVLQDGDFFGEITLITGFPRTATVRTTAVSTCISLERGQFNRMLERFPELRRALSEIAVERLRQSSKAVAVLA
jgi:ATP-binding cassette subfamily B protein